MRYFLLIFTLFGCSYHRAGQNWEPTLRKEWQREPVAGYNTCTSVVCDPGHACYNPTACRGTHYRSRNKMTYPLVIHSSGSDDYGNVHVPSRGTSQ